MLRDCCTVCLSVTLVYCGQTVGWIKMPLGTKVGLSPSDIHFVRWWPSSPQRKRHSSPPLFDRLGSGMVAYLSNCWAIVIITQAESRCLFYYPTEDMRLSWPGDCNRGALPIQKGVYCSGCPLWGSLLGYLTLWLIAVRHGTTRPLQPVEGVAIVAWFWASRSLIA